MNKTFKLAKGYAVHTVDGVSEGFSISKIHDLSMFVVNVTAPRLNHVFYSLCSLIEDTAYFTLEIQDPEAIPGTKDIYFWTDIHQDEFWGIYSKYAGILMSSGAVSIGYTSHYEEDEIYLGAYKNIRIFTREPEKYKRMLESFLLPEIEYLTTVEELEHREEIEHIPFSTRDTGEILEMLGELIRSKLRFGTRYHYK